MQKSVLLGCENRGFSPLFARALTQTFSKILKNSGTFQLKTILKGCIYLVYSWGLECAFEGNPQTLLTALVFSIMKYLGAHELGFFLVQVDWKMCP